MVHINRASQYQRDKGITEVPTKTHSSARSITLPRVIFDVLSEYRAWWASQKLILGDAWRGTSERLFVQADGAPINPDTLNFWLDRFIEKHGLPHFTPHSCRHTFASLQIANGVDDTTGTDRTRASLNPSHNIYSHALKTAAEAASDVVDDILTPPGAKRA